MAKILKIKKKLPSLKGVVLPKEVQFDYIKSNFFRVITMDGAFGGLNPQGTGIHMAVYNERRALPTKTVNPLNSDGTLGAEVLDKRQVRNAYVREIEADIILDLNAAIVLQAWLSEKIAECAKAQGLSSEQLQEAATRASDARVASRGVRKK